jgi:hypothetical protein
MRRLHRNALDIAATAILLGVDAATAPVSCLGEDIVFEPGPEEVLRGAVQFESAAIGYEGSPSAYAVAWVEILEGFEPREKFADLLERAPTIPGRLYGLAGLWHTDPAAARAWVAHPPAWAEGEVDVLFGCIGWRMQIRELLPNLKRGEWISGLRQVPALSSTRSRPMSPK